MLSVEPNTWDSALASHSFEGGLNVGAITHLIELKDLGSKTFLRDTVFCGSGVWAVGLAVDNELVCSNALVDSGFVVCLYHS